MGKKKRKMRPEPPKHFWLDVDGCWFCKNIAEKRSQRKIDREEKKILDNY